MLPGKKRLNKGLFQEINKTGKTISSPFFSFKYIKKQPLGSVLNTNTAKFAFVAPKAVAKGAVERNKLRRQGYNIIRTMPGMEKYKISEGIFFYKKTAKNADLSELKKDIQNILNKV